MSLTNIEYGSLASSATLNQNFTYLDNKITENYTTLQTSISSLLSNIATINTRLMELSEDIEDVEDGCDVKISTLKTKTKTLVNSANMLPDWNNYIAISDISHYRATDNGYLFLITASATGTLTINDNTVQLNQPVQADNLQSFLNVFPLKKGDVISASSNIGQAYFLPTLEAVWEVDISQ